jgi:hypothetical protein
MYPFKILSVQETKPDAQQNVFNQQSFSSQPQGQFSQQKFRHHPSPQKQPIAAASQTLQQDLTPSPRSKQPMYQNVGPYFSESPIPDRSADVTVVRLNSSQQANLPTVGQVKRQFQPESPPFISSRQPTVINGHTKGKDYFDGAKLSNVAAKMDTAGSGSGSGTSSVANRQKQPPPFQAQPHPSASPRLQRPPLKPSDMSECNDLNCRFVHVALSVCPIFYFKIESWELHFRYILV